LADYRDGTLPPEQAARVAAHLSDCDSCSRQVRQPGSSRSTVRRGDTAMPSAPPPQARPSGPPAELASSGKFTVLGKLGEGGMGSVWKAKHAFLDCLVAIKVMNAAARAAGGERFLQEMRAAGKLHHKNIVRAYDAEQVGGLLILVMELIDGIDLD